ncbi:MAG: FkbM family methyltransferase [Bacteroidia bacterium]|nr:FkbM family methyltransferase [Bacteroidia bacterium]
MSLSIKLGNFLYNNAFALYKPMYYAFKKKQDDFEIKLLKEYIRPGQVILDIGANIGFYAEILSDLSGPKGQVHCFEPDKKNFSYLQKHLANRKNTFLNNKAVGPKTGTISIYTSKELNVDHRTYQPEEFDKEIKIESVSIDDYLSHHSINKVDLIKMDIQGFEMEALKGMHNTLQQNPDVKIISEFWPYGLRTAGSSLSAYYRQLCSYGFSCYLLEKNSLKPLNEAQVTAMEPLDKEHYFNLFITRQHV